MRPEVPVAYPLTEKKGENISRSQSAEKTTGERHSVSKNCGEGGGVRRVLLAAGGAMN